MDPGTDVFTMALHVWANIHGLTSLLVARPTFPWPDLERSSTTTSRSAWRASSHPRQPQPAGRRTVAAAAGSLSGPAAPRGPPPTVPLPPPPPPPPHLRGRPGASRPRGSAGATRPSAIAIAVLLVLGASARSIGWDDGERRAHPPGRSGTPAWPTWPPSWRTPGACEFDHPVDVDFLTPEEYTRGSPPRTPTISTTTVIDELDRSAAQLRALGVASGEIDLVDAVQPGERRRHARLLRPRRRAGPGAGHRDLDRPAGHPRPRAHPRPPGPALRPRAPARRTTIDDGALTARRALAEGDATPHRATSYVPTSSSDAERAAYDEEYAGELEASIEGTAGGPRLPHRPASPSRTRWAHRSSHLLDATTATTASTTRSRDPPDHRGAPLRPGQLPRPTRGPSDPTSASTTTTTRRRRRRSAARPGSSCSAQRIDPEQAFDGRARAGAATSTRSYERDGRTCVRAVFAGDTEADEQRDGAPPSTRGPPRCPAARARSTSTSTGHPGLDACDPGERRRDLGVRDISVDLLELPAVYGATSRRRPLRSSRWPRPGASPGALARRASRVERAQRRPSSRTQLVDADRGQQPSRPVSGAGRATGRSAAG